MNIAYETCKDYKTLLNLIKSKKEIICFLKYDTETEIIPDLKRKDICIAKWTKTDIEFRVRGLEYIFLNPSILQDDFTKICEFHEVEFIVPTKM